MKLAAEAEERAHRIKMENEKSARETAQFESFTQTQATLMQLCMTMMGKKGTNGENEKQGSLTYHGLF